MRTPRCHLPVWLYFDSHRGCTMTARIPKTWVSISLLLGIFYSTSISSARPYEAVRIFTYGSPCLSRSRNLPITIEGPGKPIEEPKAKVEMKFQVQQPEVRIPSRTEYPIVGIEIPEIPKPRTEVPPATCQCYQGKSYGVKIEALQLPSAASTAQRSYNFGLEIPVIQSQNNPTQNSEQVKLLTGLTSKVDRILLPACEMPDPKPEPCNCEPISCCNM